MSIDMGRRIVQCEEKFETAWFGLKESAREGVSFQTAKEVLGDQIDEEIFKTVDTDGTHKNPLNLFNVMKSLLVEATVHWMGRSFRLLCARCLLPCKH